MNDLSSYPDILTPADLIKILPVGRNKVYSLLANKEIRSIRCGKKILIPKVFLTEFLQTA